MSSHNSTKDDFAGNPFADILNGADSNAPRGTARGPQMGTTTSFRPARREPDPATAARNNMTVQRDKLDPFNKLLLDHRINSITRAQAEAAADLIFKHEFLDLTHKLTLTLGASKQQNFACYLRATGETVEEIMRLKAKVSGELASVFEMVGATVLEKSGASRQRIERLIKEGVISEAEAAMQMQNIAEIRDQQIEEIKADFKIMLNNHKELLRITLATIYEDFQRTI